MNKRNSYEIYAEQICKNCNNRLNEKDLCKITRREDIVKCDSYVRCMTTKCNRCKNEKNCFIVTAKQNKPVMKGLV